ncbi:MAG: ATP-binding protein [Patescibacteria group bacterium]|nr:ATP-binding protein [Patescibacteria group bacterium]
MSSGGEQIKKFKMERVWLLFFNIFIATFYGVLIFFTDWEIINYYGLKIAVIISGFYAVFHFISNYFFEKKSNFLRELSYFLTSIYVIILVDYLGGPGGYFALLLFILIIGAFLYRTLWGIAYASVVFIYAIMFGFLTNNEIADQPIKYFVIFISILISSLAGYYINRRNQKIFAESQSLKKVADKLTAEKSQDEAVLTAIADGVYAVDRDRNLVLLNKAAQEMTGWSEKDALGIKCQTVMKLIAGEQNISVCEKDCPALAVWNTGKPVFRNDTCFIHRKNKNRIQLSSSYAPIKDLDENIVGAICVFRDVTKDKELERQRNEFVSTASHELRTPITATEGYLSIITDSGMCKIDDNSKEYLTKARNTLMGMSTLVKNLLSVTKIEEGKLETVITNFPIKDLVIEVIEVFEKKAKERGIELKMIESKELATGGGKKAIGRALNVRADREMIREVLNNLVENGIKFTEKGGVTISIDYDKEFATVNIEDTGMGMPKDAEKHLFEKFYRVDNTATREVGGTGLGLYITRSIVETFGGKIWVESTMGKGSRFHFTIPLALDS